MRLVGRITQAAFDAAAAGVVIARATRRVVVNTGKRTLSLMPASSTKNLDEAVDYLFDAAIKIKRSSAADSPGGATITLDELLSTISDGAVKESISNMWETIGQLTRGDQISPVELVKQAVNVLLDLLGTLRDALADGRITKDEVLHGITDGGIRKDLSNALDGIGDIPAELQGLDMWRMIALVQRIMTKLPALLS